MLRIKEKQVKQQRLLTAWSIKAETALCRTEKRGELHMNRAEVAAEMCRTEKETPLYRTGAHTVQYRAEKKVWLYRTGSMAEQHKAQMQIQTHGADGEKSRKSGSP